MQYVNQTIAEIMQAAYHTIDVVIILFVILVLLVIFANKLADL